MTKTSGKIWCERLLFVGFALPSLVMLTGGCVLFGLVKPASPDDLKFIAARLVTTTPALRSHNEALQQPIQISFSTATKLAAFVHDNYSWVKVHAASCAQWNQVFREERQPVPATGLYWRQEEFGYETFPAHETPETDGTYVYAFYLDKAHYPALGSEDLCFSLQGREYYGPAFETNIVTIPAAALAAALAKAPE